MRCRFVRSSKLVIGTVTMGLISCLVTPAIASETVSYTYDAKGRLVKVVRTGTVNNSVATEYEHDKADNRMRVKTAGVP